MQAPSKRPPVRYRSRSEEPEPAAAPIGPDAGDDESEEAEAPVELGRAGGGGGGAAAPRAGVLEQLAPAVKAAAAVLRGAGAGAGIVAVAGAALLGLGLRWRRRRGGGSKQQQRHAHAAAHKGGGPASNGTAAAAGGPKKRRGGGAAAAAAAAPPKPGPLSRLRPTKDCVPTADGLLAVVRRPIAADNSCLFNSVGYCMHQSKSRAPFLRRVVSNEVSGDPETWGDAFLGMPNAAYCAWINEPHNWGGGIELAILAAHYRREIAAWNIESGEPHVFGEESGFKRQVGIIYSGTHYDALAVTSRPGAASWEEDVTEFNPRTKQGKQILEAMRTLVRLNNKTLAAASKAAQAGKAAASEGAGKQQQQQQQQKEKQQAEKQQAAGPLKCGSCEAVFGDQQAAVGHAQATGHTEFSQMV